MVRRFCQQGPALLDPLPRPRYLVLLDEHVLPVNDPAAIVAATHTLGTEILHIIDVEAVLRDLAVTPHE